MRSPNLNALKMFDAAARHLNFRLAAEELNLTQGAVAQQVRRLESDLGFQLFHRKARGLALTELGQKYHQPIHRAPRDDRRRYAKADAGEQHRHTQHNSIICLKMARSPFALIFGCTPQH